MLDSDIARDDTIRVDGWPFRWVVDAIVPEGPYTICRLHVSRTWRGRYGTRISQRELRGVDIARARLVRKGNDDADGANELFEAMGMDPLPRTPDTHVLRSGRIVAV